VGRSGQLSALQPLVQVDAEGVARYLPAAQATHDVAPVLEPVLVIDPAAQVMQAVWEDEL
jgi:hypothetical protein